MSETKEFLEKYIESEEGQSIKTLIAYTIRKTPTEKDDIILENADEAAEVLSKMLAEIQDVNPTDKEAKDAGVSILKSIALLTKTKWDDRAVAILNAIL